MKIARLAHQLPAKMDHRLEPFVAHFRRFLNGPLERFVTAARKLRIQPHKHGTHLNLSSSKLDVVGPLLADLAPTIPQNHEARRTNSV